MAAATSIHAVERGVDARGTAVIAFGGAGPVHACAVAELLDAPVVVFPAHASVLSAFGALVTPVRIDLARSHVSRLTDMADDAREELLTDMRAEGLAMLAGAGVGADEVAYRYGIDARYEGQGNEVTIWVGDGPVWPADLETVSAQFAEHYEAVYGLAIPDVPIEAVTWRLSVFGRAPDVSGALAPRGEAGATASKGTRPVRFDRREPLETPVLERSALGVGSTVTGPALIEEADTTAVLRPGWRATVNADGSLLAERREEGLGR
jgi:N-methylhydantoinase A